MKLDWLTDHLKHEKVYVSTGINGIDRIIDGFYPGTVTTIGARPKVGKSTLTMNMVLNTKHLNHTIFTTEVSKERYMEVFLSMLSEIPDEDIRQRSSEIMDILTPAIGEAGEYNLSLFDTPRPTIGEVESAIQNTSPDVVWIDYFQKLAVSGNNSRYSEFSNRMEELEELSKKYAVPIVMTSQLKRFDSKREQAIPELSDLKETGKIEETSRAVLLLYQEAGELIVNVAANRYGSIGDVRLRGQWSCNKLEETV